MNAGTLTIIVGLPGAGKSTEVKKIRPSITGLCIEDFHADAFEDSDAVEHSRHYWALIEALLAGRDCVIADIAFCDSERRATLEDTIRERIPGVDIEWKFFDNDYEKCEKNIRFRSRQTLENDLENLKQFASKYIIPAGVQTIPIWQPP